MKISALSAVAFLAAAFSARADDPAPAQFQGNWVGNIRTHFGLAAPNDQNSWECLPNGNNQGVNIQNVQLNITATQFVQGAYPQQNVQAGVATFRWPASNGQQLGWSTITNDNILMLRTSATTVECKWARVTGTGNNRQLVIVTLGGAAYPNWQDQCVAANYQAIGGVENNPICVTVSAQNRAAFNSTVLETYTIGGANINPGNGTGNGTVPTPGPNATATPSAMPSGSASGQSGAASLSLAGLASILMAGAVLKHLW